MIHQELCERAKRWLRGSRRCDPVFSNIASCGEIPDAIGWSSAYQWCGSTVIECKTSLTDFHADRKKYLHWKHPNNKWVLPASRIPTKEAKKNGYEPVIVPSMGNYRFYLCLPGILSDILVEEYMPDHGLLWMEGRRYMRMIRPAPKRERVDKDAEIRYLRFAILNGKNPYGWVKS